MGEGVLSGIKVLDFTQVLSGPYCTMWLSDMGAEVIKVENPGKGDITRTYPPYKMDGMCAYFSTINRNKKGITLNLKTEEAVGIVKEMASKVDIVTENFRPGVMDRLGIGYDVLSGINPGIIFASISGFGSYGPDSMLPGYDVISQGIGGLMFVTGQPDAGPTRAGSSFGDTLGGLNTAVGILAALVQRERTGVGRHIDISLTDCVTALCNREIDRYLGGEDIPTRLGNRYRLWHPYGIYKACDGWYAIGCGTDKQFNTLAGIVGIPEEDMKNYVGGPARSRHREEIDGYINSWAGDKTAKEASDILIEADIPSGMVMNIDQMAKDPQIAGAREMFPMQYQEGLGSFPVTSTPIRFSKSGIRKPGPAPLMGQDNEEVLSEYLGMSSLQVADLKSRGII